MNRSLVGGILLLVGLALAVSIVLFMRDARRPAPGPPSRAHMDDETAARDIKMRGRIMAEGMIRAGIDRPSPQQFDLLSRHAQEKLGDAHSPEWFKEHFEAGFAAGWKPRPKKPAGAEEDRPNLDSY